MAEQPLKLIVEALLFASDTPLSARSIQECVPESSLPEIKAALEELRREYETMERSFTVKEVGEGYQFRTRSLYAAHVLRMFKKSPARLSRAALETLAIIAYKQPVLRQEIEQLRGVDVGGILKTLMEKNLVRIMGRKSLPGRPLIYGTTKRFLEVFDLQDLESLPKLKEIRDLASEEETVPEEGHAGQPEEPPTQEETTSEDENREES